MMRNIFASPTRAVTVLSVTQILGWAVLYYPPVLTMPLVAQTHGWSFAFAMLGFSVGLGVAGLISPYACALIDDIGGNAVMSLGALLGASGLAAIALASHPVIYLAAWILIGAAMASTLYDPAFTTLTRIYGVKARPPITFVTFAGGLASTVGWPATHLLIEHIGWQGAYLVFAAVLALVIAPLHAFALPRTLAAARPSEEAVVTAAAAPYIAPRGWPFLLIACGFATYAFILSGLSSNLLSMLQRGGIDAGHAVLIGMIIGPAQVLSRLADFLLASRVHPVWIVRAAMALMAAAFALIAFAPLSFALAAAFAFFYGCANGVVTITRGTLPLALFGPTGYGRVIGRVARPALILQAAAPYAWAFSVERWSDRTVLALAVACAITSLLCFMLLKRPVRAANS